MGCMNWLFRSRVRELEAENVRLVAQCESLRRQADDLNLRLKTADAHYIRMYAENGRLKDELKAAREQPGGSGGWVQARMEGVK